MALAGLILGYVMSVGSVVVVLSFFAAQVAIKKANLIKTKVDAVAAEAAIVQFFQEYSKLPSVGAGSAEFRTEGEAGVQLLTILMGREVNGGSVQNSRHVPFLSVTTGEHRKRGGLIYRSVTGGSVVGLFDAWGNPFRVILDDDYDEVIRFTYGGKPEVVKGERVLVASKGPDGVEGTEDDVKSW
jgi:hypothetical protein